MPDASQQLPKSYQPTKVEEKWFQQWIKGKCFQADETSEKEGYSIVIPPPNVTGILHLGHVLNNTIQDILARRNRQLGKEVLWLPGTDHAGIATQTKVEKQLRQDEGLTRHDVGRERFLKQAWDWKEKHGGIIIKQLKRLGCSCDWERERFTMDANYSEWVSHVFTDLFKEGLIYRGKRMVNWCPASLTALSDEEVIMKERQSKLYYLKYEIIEEPGQFIEIATTRPETLMGDSAVAVHPDSQKWAQFIGKTVRRPFPQAPLPIIADEHVDPEFGTGALKITPAHDKADFEIGQRHGLEIIEILTPEGTINCPDCPDLHGLDRFVARKKAAEKLEELGLLLKIEEYENNVGFSERADVPVEPRISMQWFLKYPCVQEAKNAVSKGSITYRPERWAKTYAHWLEHIQDWCISRQLWWGHRIPVWYKKDQVETLKNAESLTLEDLQSDSIYVGVNPPSDPSLWVQDEDVLDTWFSSWLWPFATMTTQEKTSPLLAKFYPTGDLVTGPDILFFWVARMIMASERFQQDIPFKNVFFTSIVRDRQGRKMSKSLGNSPDPLDLIDTYGADALRYGLMRIAPIGTDIKFDESQIEEGRNFANKIYNACRFRLLAGVTNKAPLQEDLLPPYHLTILHRCDQLASQLKKAYDAYKFNEAASLLYEFLWSDLCDQFLEAVKKDLREEASPEQREQTLTVFDAVMARFLQHLHPFMPHLTEELSHLMGYLEEEEFLMLKPLPDSPLLPKPPKMALAQSEAIYHAASRLRNLKAEYQLANNKNVQFIITGAPEWLTNETATLTLLAGAQEIRLEPHYEAPKGTPATVTDLGECYLPLDGLIDLDAETARLNKEIQKISQEVSRSQGKLANEKFIANAKPEVVSKERERLADWEQKLTQLKKMLDSLK